ncbi:hypothetical protein BGX21_000533 [Mortierella sp. AD011]|nr:hypothetical protein BGX21_000533 [Mortierella sp. AD011]
MMEQYQSRKREAGESSGRSSGKSSGIPVPKRIRPTTSNHPEIEALSSNTTSFSDVLAVFSHQANVHNNDDWILETKTSVDKALVQFALNLNHEHLVHSFVFDTDCIAAAKSFTKHELGFIRSNSKKKPSLENNYAEYLASFCFTNMEELRRRLEKNDSEAQGASMNVLSTRRWIYATILHFANLIDGKAHNGYGQHQSERWYELNLWRPLVDDYLLNDPDIIISRGESTSNASSYRKNIASLRLHGERKRSGRKIDGLFKEKEYGLEIGGIEVGPLEEDSTGSKSLSDGLKLGKLLKDQHDYVLQKISMEKSAFSTFGMQMTGRSIQFIELDYKQGKFMRLKRVREMTPSPEPDELVAQLARQPMTPPLRRVNLPTATSPGTAKW